MKLAAVFALVLTSCTARKLGNALRPEEVTLGRSTGTSSLSGQVNTWWEDEEWPVEMDGESESTSVALTWHLPSMNDSPSRQEREDIRASSVILDLAEEEANELPMTTGATFQADGRHAAIFAGVIGLLIIFLLIKLRRSNGWH